MSDARSVIYTGRVIELGLERVELPGGRRCELEVVRHGGGAAVAAVDDAGRVCLLRQYRHAVGGWIWELPAGCIEPGEAPDATARRELEEEAGRVAATWTSLGGIASSPGVFTEIIHLYLARDLEVRALAHEAEEIIEVNWIDLDAAIARVDASTPGDAKTVIGLQRARRCIEGGAP